jgi:hypothetical protein
LFGYPDSYNGSTLARAPVNKSSNLLSGAKILKQKKMTKAEQYQQIILQTNDWFDEKTEQLQLLIDKKDDSKILFEGKDGEKVEMPEALKEGFYFGIQTAIEVFGKFPVKITKNQ